MIDSHVMDITPEKVDIDQPLPTTTHVTSVDKVGSLAKKRGRPSKENSISAEKASDQITSDATPAKTQKLTDNLDSSGNSKPTTPVSIQGKSMKGKKGFQKRSSVVRALFTASQELMPPPLTTFSPNDTTMDLTLSNLTLNSDTTPTVEDNWTNEDTLLANILAETHVSNMDLQEVDANPVLTDCALGCYLSYLCTVTPVKCIAVHPSFISNYYAKEVRERNVSMQASDFLINPRSHSFNLVSHIFIPVLLRELNPVPMAILTSSIGHWILGIYNVHERRLVHFDPYGRDFDQIALFQFRRTLTTLPIQLSANDFSIENKLRLNFNTQSFNDSINCGYYVCLYAEMNLTTNFQGSIKLK
uniref:Ubiquitin-like protease family profile domain-containing protein n=1 Tax=Romanomermis culicivorax TaxID=13658 RepID=A0A915IIA1_ROMCU